MEFTVAELLRDAVLRLAARGLPSPRQDAELLLADVLGENRAFLLAHPEFPVPAAPAKLFRRWIEKRADWYPIQYLRGRQEFFGREFLLDERVLIPRPETELVVEVALDLLRGTPRPRILEIGVGSGCIAVTLACERGDARIVGTDVSPGALEVARLNARRHGVLSRVLVFSARTVQPIGAARIFDLIVSNPPYVALGDPRIAPEVSRWEPRAALFAGATGLEVHREILAEAGPLLSLGGHLVLEIGEGQKPGAVRLAEEHGWKLAGSFFDLARIDRCLVLSRS